MKNIAIDIDYKTKPEKLAVTLKSHNLHEGDKLAVSTSLDEEMTLLIVVAALHFLHEKFDYANKLLKDIFSSKGSAEIQEEIVREYGIDVEVKAVSEENNWHQFSKEKLAKAYGTDEPEYDESMVKEPNPDYKKK